MARDMIVVSVDTHRTVQATKLIHPKRVSQSPPASPAQLPGLCTLCPAPQVQASVHMSEDPCTLGALTDPLKRGSANTLELLHSLAIGIL